MVSGFSNQNSDETTLSVIYKMGIDEAFIKVIY
jgi:hypothetical protein